MASGPLDVACSMFDTFCEDSDEVALLYDLDLRYVAINRAGLAALGLERSAVLGKTNRELLGDEGEAMEEKLRSVAARGAAQTWAHVVNGEAYETTYAPVVGAGGVVGVAGRCHRTAEAAAEARARAESLAREHARATNLISMLESNPRVLTWVLDPRGELVEYVSAPACTAILGVDAATLLGTAQAALLHPDDVECVRDALRRAEAPRRRLTYRRRVPDGSYATVALAPGAWHRDGSGRLYVQESSVSQLLNEESIAFKQMYITRTAHDLKTPITSFRLALDQLDRLLDKSTSTDESAPALALVEQARHATEFMQIIVRQAIDVGKLQAGQSISPTRGTVDLDGLLTKCDWLLAGYPKACSVSLGRDEARVSRYVVSDGEWLWEILMNFLTNACKYTASGGIDLRITTVTRRTSSPDLRNSDAAGAAEKTMLRVECADSGIGVPPAKRHGLFRPFGTLQAKTLHGTGIGLFNVQQKCLALMGKVGMSDRNDGEKGSLFWAEVPYEPDDGPTPDDAASLQSPDAPTINHSPALDRPYGAPRVFKDRTALLVDDTGTILSLMVHIFQRKRFTVMTASNGADALEKLTRNAFDICLMDVQMPTMDGLECTRRLRAWEAGKATSVDSNRWFGGSPPNFRTL
ncbi:hypothetical protein SO694_00032258 [Aureococcus anophagefferens]|uniref:histidine kinase n=1 Tax=Aureococcus anophagefferens TaxID=44056 RepID=A0ABR1FKG1_AURAN